MLNLPSKVIFSNGASVSYTYDATGRKLKVIHVKAGKTHIMDYIGNHIYEDGTLSQTLIEGGYLTYRGSSPVYHFYAKDHLGNNRMVLSANGNVEQVTHYYPYGMSFAEGTNADIQRFKYNGKELDTDNGLNWMDYGARMYDASLSRWGGVDALAEKYSNMSVYGYCGGNPVIQVDADGNGWYSVTDPKTGETNYEWSDVYHSKDDFDKNIKEIQERHKGMNLEFKGMCGYIDNNNKGTYYNLFGLSASGKEAKQLEGVDQLFINYANSSIDSEGNYSIKKTDLGRLDSYNPNEAWNYCNVKIGMNGEKAQFPLSTSPTQNYLDAGIIKKGGLGSTNTNRGMLGYKLPNGRYFPIYSPISQRPCGVIAFPSPKVAEKFDKLYESMIPYL